MTESRDAADAGSSEEPKKPYAPPKLTEYGSVSKLTMAKGSTDVEIVPNKKRGACL